MSTDSQCLDRPLATAGSAAMGLAWPIRPVPPPGRLQLPPPSSRSGSKPQLNALPSARPAPGAPRREIVSAYAC